MLVKTKQGGGQAAPKPSYTIVSKPVLMELICPECGWVQEMGEGLQDHWKNQEHFKEQYPDNWREKVHPLTCMYCKGEMILHG